MTLGSLEQRQCYTPIFFEAKERMPTDTENYCLTKLYLG
uniref:Uncharacterized protein n=1 Tax=Lepeophtheirus salmonis TaxID=72036 RepID=A0A0K2U1S4_LEPSM